MSRKKRRSAPGKPGLHPAVLPAIAVALTFLVRLWFVLGMRGTPYSSLSAHVVDSWYYHNWALEILGGNFWGSEVFFLRPLYPYLLAFAYAVFGRGNVLAVQLLQALMAAASCLLLWDATRRMFSRAAAHFAAFGFAITGILVFYSGALLYVEITILLSLLTAWLVLVAGDRWWRWLIAGMAFGLLVICRPEFLLLLPAYVVILWRQKRRLGRLAVMAAAALVVIAVVPVRNFIVARDPVLFTAHSGFNFYYGNNPSADGTWQPAPELERTAGFSHTQLKRIGKVIDGREVPWSVASNHWLRRGLDYLARNPARAAWLVGRRFLLFWAGYEVPSNYYPETARAGSLPLRLSFVNFALLVALGLPGMLLAWRRRGRSWPAYLFVAVHLASALTFYVMSRLRAPVIPFLLMFAGFAVGWLVDALRQRRRLRAAAVLGAGVLVYAGSSLVPADHAGYSSQAWTQAGNISLTRKQAGPAADAFLRALEANPDNPSARYSLIILYAGMGRAADAEGQYRELAARAGSDPRYRPLVFLGAARLAIARRDFPLAADLYGRAIDADPQNAESHYLLGLVYVSMDSLEPARASLGRALAIDPAHAEARSTLAAVEARMREGR